jgi:hypothetical protein
MKMFLMTETSSYHNTVMVVPQVLVAVVRARSPNSVPFTKSKIAVNTLHPKLKPTNYQLIGRFIFYNNRFFVENNHYNEFNMRFVF